MTATAKNQLLALRLGISEYDAEILRRASMTLQHWAEQECGGGNDYASWAIERDEQTGQPFMARYPHNGTATRTRIADRETGALRRVKAVCLANSLFFYHQTDPRGCALYVSREPLTDTDYPKGVAV